MKNDDVYLRHILDAIGKIEEYTSGIDEVSFFGSTLIQDGVYRQLEIIGEASRRLSDELKERHDHIPWRSMIGLRNRIAHEYIDLDIEVIRDVVRSDLPVLHRLIGKLSAP